MINLNQKIKGCEHFIYKEVLYSSLANWFVEPKDFQLDLIHKFFQEVIEPIREEIGAMKITSGVRDKKIMEVLRAKGYMPSKRTDHSYLDPEVNQWGCGAIDFIPLAMDIKEVYKLLCKKYFYEEIDFGQLILYDSEVKGKESFIHISYPKNKLFTDKLEIVKSIQKEKFLQCKKGNGNSIYYIKVEFDGDIPLLK